MKFNVYTDSVRVLELRAERVVRVEGVVAAQLLAHATRALGAVQSPLQYTTMISYLLELTHHIFL